MQKQRTSSGAPNFILLGVMSMSMIVTIVRSDFNLEETEVFPQYQGPDVDYLDGNVNLRLLEETCRQYPEVSLCSYWHAFKNPEALEETGEANGQRLRKKRETASINHTAESVQENGTNGLLISSLEKREAAAAMAAADDRQHNEVLESLVAPEYYYEPEVMKRFDGYRARNPETEGYKRGPGFRSWGGKRTRFTSWGGKRDSGKGSRFSNWGGKRDTRGYKFNNWGGKRSRFTSWGGKRDKVSKFNSWGGKRSDLNELEANEDEFIVGPDKKSKFNSWGGKRGEDTTSNSDEKRDAEYPISYDIGEEDDDYENDNDNENDISELNLVKRKPFQSWGGKRAYLFSRNPQVYIRRDDIRKFLNWGGKRKFSSWGGKRSFDEEEKRGSFNSWGGKRDGRPKVKSSFQSWGGKRSNMSTDVNTSDENATEVDEGAIISDNYVNKRGFSERQKFLKTAVLGDLLHSSALALGPRRRSEFFPWGGKRELDEISR